MVLHIDLFVSCVAEQVHSVMQLNISGLEELQTGIAGLLQLKN